MTEMGAERSLVPVPAGFRMGQTQTFSPLLSAVGLNRPAGIAVKFDFVRPSVAGGFGRTTGMAGRMKPSGF